MEAKQQAILSPIGRLLLGLIFLISALGNKIPNFNDVAGYMASQGVPMSKVMLAGGIAFLVLGSISIILGFKARCGALLLLIFLALATYFFHDFWTFVDPKAKEQQMIQFLKNLALMGAMLFIIANGPGAYSIDKKCCGENE